VKELQVSEKANDLLELEI